MDKQICFDAPVEKTFRILSFRIRVISVVLKQSAIIRLVLEQEYNGQTTMENKELILDGDDYLNWGSDDDYLIEWVKGKLPILI